MGRKDLVWPSYPEVRHEDLLREYTAGLVAHEGGLQGGVHDLADVVVGVPVLAGGQHGQPELIEGLGGARRGARSLGGLEQGLQ